MLLLKKGKITLSIETINHLGIVLRTLEEISLEHSFSDFVLKDDKMEVADGLST